MKLKRQLVGASLLENLGEMTKKSLFALAKPIPEESKLGQTDNLSRISEQPSHNQSKMEEIRRLPKRRITDKTKKKMTVLFDKRKEINFAAQRLEEQKYMLKSSGFTQTSHAVAYSVQIEAAPSLVPTTDTFYKTLELCVKKYSTLRLLRLTVPLFIVLNLMIVSMLGGIILFTGLKITQYSKYVTMHGSVQTNLQACRKLLRHAIQIKALRDGLVSESRYNHIADYDSASNLDYLRRYSVFLEKERNHTIDQLEKSANDLIGQVSNLESIESLMLNRETSMENILAPGMSSDLDRSMIAGQILRIGSLAFIFNQAVLRNSWPENLTLQNLLDYLMDNIKQAAKIFSEQYFEEETESMLFQLGATQFLIYAIVLIISMLVTTGVVAFVVVIRRLANLLKALSYVTPHDIQERMTQLRAVMAKMDKMKESLYYMCDQLDEGYVLSQEKKEDQEKTKAPKIHFKVSKFLFPRLGIAAVFLMVMYLLLAGLTLAILILTSNKAGRLRWLQDNQQVIDTIQTNYETNFNEILSLLVLKNLTLENKPYSVFFSNYGDRIRNSMNYFSQLTSETSSISSSSSFNANLLSVYRSLYSDNICDRSTVGLRSVCRLVDGQTAVQGFAQIERRLAELFSQVYRQSDEGMQTSTIMGQRYFVEIEFAYAVVYEPIIERLMIDTVNAMAVEAGYSDLLAYIVASVCITALVTMSSAVSYQLCDASVRSTLHACFTLSVSSLTPAKRSAIGVFVVVDS